MSTLNSVIQIGTLAALPAASIAGRLYFTSDTLHVYRDNGTAWIDCTPVGGALANPMTTPGDVIVGGTGGTPTRLAAGANGNLLSVVAGVPSYVANVPESQVTNLTTDLAAKEVTANKGVANGYASLDASGLVPSAQIPPLAIDHTYVVASQAAMLALAANVGDVAIRSDVNETFILQAAPATTLGNWQQVLTPASPVQSVNGLVGIVSLASTNLSDSSALARLASGPALAVAQGGLATASAPTAAQIPIAQSASAYAPKSIGGDGTLSTAGALVVTKTNGAAFAPSATTDTTNATNISSGSLSLARIAAGMKTARLSVTPPAATVNAFSAVAFTWPTAFPDVNYTVIASVVVNAGQLVVYISNQTAAGFTIQLQNLSGAATTLAIVHLMAIHE